MKYLLDSNVLIYHLNGLDVATSFLESNGGKSSLSFITVIEVMSFNYSKHERDVVKNFLNGFKRFNVDNAVIDITSALRYSTKIKLPDCIIAATAISNDLTLVTRNTSDFKRFPELNLLNPFD